MKILYLTDTHIRGTSPRSRLDDFPETLRAKLREVVSVARAHGVAAILHGGDFFDRPDVAPAVARDFLRVLMEAPCPIYGIAGNHDIFGFNPETVGRTLLGLLDQFRLFRLLRPGEVVWVEAEGLRVQVTGQEFHAEIDRRDPRLDYCVADSAEGGAHWRRPEADYAIHLTHGMLLERPFLPDVAHSLLADLLPHTRADVTFGAHYHAGWSRVYEHEGRLFIHPGALVRMGAQKGDLDRTVQVVLLEFQPGQPVRYQFLPLLSARPAEEVLDRSREAAQMARERALADFILAVGDIGQAGPAEALEVGALMERIADSAGLPPRVRAEALRRLARAQEALASGEEEPA